MIIEDVKLKNTSKERQGSPYYFKNRVVEIITDKGKFLTPSRIITRSEYVARSHVPISESLDLERAIDFRELTVEQTTQILDDNTDGVKKLLELAEQFNDITTRAIFKFAVFQPPKQSLNNMSIEDKIKFADFQADILQKRFGNGIITYPFLNLPISEYKKFIKNRNIRDEQTSTVFTFDMNMEPKHLREIIEYLTSSNEPTIIALIHRSWRDAPIQHGIISSFYSKERVAFFGCQIEREEPTSNASNLHALALGSGFDLVSLYQARKGGGSDELELDKIKIFNPLDLNITNIENALKEPGRDIIKEFNFSGHNKLDYEYVTMILEGFEGGKVYPKKHQILYYLARTHEALTSPRVFTQTREKILKNEIEEYIRSTKLNSVPMLANPLFR